MTDPRPEAAALATALTPTLERELPPGEKMHGWRCEHPDRWPPPCGCTEIMASLLAEGILAHLPAPFAIVDMDALVERVARNMFSDPDIWREFPEDSQASWLAIPERQALYRAKARTAIEGGRHAD